MHNRVGLGTFPLASVFNPISTENAENLVRSFIDQGGYYIDTAPMYGFGDVEKILGTALREIPREKYFVATKCGRIDVEGKTFATLQKSAKYADIMRECERSLSRLQLDYIDLYFIHSPDKNTPFEETMQALEKLKTTGKIGDIGVSNVNLAELREYNQTGLVKYVQNNFSLINQSIDRSFADYLIGNKIKLVPYHVLEIGLLTGSVYEDITKLQPADLRNSLKYWQGEPLRVVADWVKTELSPIAKELGITIGQLSMSWALAQKYVGFIIIGTTKDKYLPINLKVDTIELSNATLTKLDFAYQSLERTIAAKFKLSIREFRGLNEKYY